MNTLNENAAAVAESSLVDSTHRPSPSELGVWVFVLADMCIFALYFAVFLWDRTLSPEQFLAGQATLDTRLGGLNTVVLLFSSWFVATAVKAARMGDAGVYRWCIRLTIACGLIFLGVKAVEYSGKFSAGLNIATNVFYRDYFAFTGLHMLHVILGLAFLVWLLLSFSSSDQLKDNVRAVEGVGLYWHMVDLLWVVLFAMIYLVK